MLAFPPCRAEDKSDQPWEAGTAAVVMGKAGIEWVAIPDGSFMMGAKDLGQKVHKVKVKSFEMTKTLVTNTQYKTCVDDGACKAAVDYGEEFSGDDQPVVGVNWNNAKAFCKWAGGRLPSEAEWEYAARSAGKDRKYPWGDEEATCERAVISEGGAGCGKDSPWPVCSKPAGNTKQGLCDMAGNVWEWMQDWYHFSYDNAPTDGSAREKPADPFRVYRGGSWIYDARFARSALRRDIDPGARVNDLGFRCAR